MSGWCDFLCDFPDDDDATLDAILGTLPGWPGCALTHTPLPYFRARLSSSGAAVALAIAVPDVLQVRGITEDSEVLVPLYARVACERQIADLNHGPTRWTRLGRIEASEEVWQIFDLLRRNHLNAATE